MQPYDIFIPIAEKDYNKLKFLVRSIEENLQGWQNIYVTSPRGDKILEHPRIKYFRDREIIDFDFTRFPYRPGWQTQMVIKLFQDVTEHDFYLTVDSDLIFNRSCEVFNSEGQPIEFLGWEQNHRSYFEFQEKFDLPRDYPHTFISDTNFINKQIIQEMLERYNHTVQSFLEFMCINTVPGQCYLGEPEIWGQYLHKFHPGYYEFRQMKTEAYCPRFQDQYTQCNTDQVWHDEEIQGIINMMKTKDLDFFMLHSWSNDNTYRWS